MKKSLMLVLALLAVCSLTATAQQTAAPKGKKKAAKAAAAAAAPKNYVTTAAPGKRVGVIGLDTSHAIAFANDFDAEPAKPEMRGLRVVAAYPIGSKDIKSSVDRREGYIANYKKIGIEIVDSIPALLEKVDFVLLESNDGRVHLEQALPVLKAHKPVFIDKPIAASLGDVLAIFRASEKYQTPVFTASSLRWIEQALPLRGGAQGAILGADAFSPAQLEPTHPDLYWYGIHGVEILYTLMGPGCQQVSRVQKPDTEFCVGEWADGRIGTFRGTRKGTHQYGGTVFCEKSTVCLPLKQSYDQLAGAIAEFFETGKSPVAREEMIEIYAFMSAADASKAAGGRPVKIADVMAKAQAEAEKVKLD